MAGGVFRSFDKTLPGVYINVKSQPSVNTAVGSRGIVAIPQNLSWGVVNKVMEYTPGEDTTPFIGYPIAHEKARFLLEMMRGTDISSGPTKILIYRYEGTGGVKANVSASVLDGNNDPVLTYTFTATCYGTRGNDISVAIIADPDNAGTYFYNTYVDGSMVDSQIITDVSEAADNAWVDVTLSGTLTALAATSLQNGTDPTASAADDAAAMTAFEPYDFDVLCYDGSNTTVIAAYHQYITRMNEEIGKKCQMVIGNYTGENSKYVISARNGVTLSDGTSFDASAVTHWLAGAEAGAQYYQSLTYAQYPTAVSAYPKLTDADVEAAITAGQIAFIDTFGVTKICTDINSKTTVTLTEGAEFKKNRVMRVVNQFCNDVYRYFSNYFIGKVDNNAEGRALFRTWIIGYLNEMQSNNGIRDFSADDVTVEAGNTIDSVVITVMLHPVDAVEKVYLTVTVDASVYVAE